MPVSRMMRMRICLEAGAVGKTTAAAMTLVAKADSEHEHRVGLGGNRRKEGRGRRTEELRLSEQ